MGIESDYNVVSDPVSGQRIRLILTPHGGAAGTGSVDVADFAAGTLVAQAIEQWLVDNLFEGSNITLDKSTPGQITVIASGASAYTAENARDDIGAALTGITNYVTVTPDDTGNLINVDIATAFKNRVSALEAARSLLQVKENVGGGGVGNYMSFPGGAGNYIDTPSNAAYNLAGDFGVVIRFKMPASAPGSDITLVGRQGSSNATTQFRVKITVAGQMQWVSSVDGVATSTPTTTAGSPLAFDGNWIWFRVTRQSSTGNVDFYTAADTGSNNTIPGSWTTFQLNRATTAGALWNNSGALSVPLSIMSYNAGASTFVGSLGRMVLYPNEACTAGTEVADANATDYTSGTSWSGGTPSRTWTISGTASVVLVGGGATSNTASEFTLADTDAFGSKTFAHKDVLYWFATGGFINTSGSSVNFTPRLLINATQLTTFPAISIASSASNVYRWECAVTVEQFTVDGSQQVYTWNFRVYNAVTGTYVGGQTSSTVHTDVGGNFAGAVTTITTVPAIVLKLTMGTAASTISAGYTQSRVSHQAA